MKFAESTVEDAALAWLGELGFSVLHGPEIASGEMASEQMGFVKVLQEAVACEVDRNRITISAPTVARTRGPKPGHRTVQPGSTGRRNDARPHGG